MPRFSVIMPAYNAERFIETAIESVQAQSVRDFELIVVDDESADDTRGRILAAADRDPRIRLLCQPHSGRPGVARNRGIAAAKGEWITFLDADDKWSHDALESFGGVMERFPEARWIGADFWVWNPESSLPLQRWYATYPPAARFLYNGHSGEEIIRLRTSAAAFLHTNLACTCAVCVKRDLLLSSGSFDSRLRMAEDIHVWLKLSCRSDYYFLPKPLAYYRRHSVSLTHRERCDADAYAQALSLLQEDPEFRPYRHLLRSTIARRYVGQAYWLRHEGRYKEACSSALQAVRFQPASTDSWRVLGGALVGRR